MSKLNLERLLVPVSVSCFDCKGEDNEPVRKTVIIALIRIVDGGDGNIQISWGCSRGAFCRDKNCRYSHAAEQDDLRLRLRHFSVSCC
ncbi:MAG: hypothetical protein ACPLKQ_01150 [Candidatus Bathyarchaeales archaeon]